MLKKLRTKHTISVTFYTQHSSISIFRRIFARDIEINMTEIINTLERRGGYITVSETRTRGEYEQLRRGTADGTLVRIRQGVYVQTEALANNMVDVERIVPRGVLCMYSAFSHYDLSTQVPSAVCVAIDAKRKVDCQNIQSSTFTIGKKKTFALV